MIEDTFEALLRDWCRKVRRDRTLTAAQRLVVLELGEFATPNPKSAAYPSIATLSRLVGISTRTVEDALRAALGRYVERATRGRGRDGNGASWQLEHRPCFDWKKIPIGEGDDMEGRNQASHERAEEETP